MLISYISGFKYSFLKYSAVLGDLEQASFLWLCVVCILVPFRLSSLCHRASAMYLSSLLADYNGTLTYWDSRSGPLVDHRGWSGDRHPCLLIDNLFNDSRRWFLCYWSQHTHLPESDQILLGQCKTGESDLWEFCNKIICFREVVS